jgi:hypothetical protein
LFSEEGDTATSRVYDDRTGISYEYPDGRYEQLVHTGEQFVYHFRGLGYVGVGIVGTIRPSATAGRFVCEVLDHQRFLEPVALKSPDGDYWEAGSDGKGVYWAQGVRPLSQSAFDGIATIGLATVPVTTSQSGRGGYATPEVARLVDEIAMSVATDWVVAQNPGADVIRMPHNNPGFDVQVMRNALPVRYVEVKGTQASEPLFFISEGERSFSAAHENQYTLVVVTGINVRTRDHGALHVREGEVTIVNSHLEPTQWRGRIPLESSPA